ncbi:DUF2971 domain-containing protein [Cytophaga aurantiaca]|uniref:DUF2971 domain-containing protein n=1 Tax=Cytophaga aurantiaca TaxID=29530 RepID=UPI000374B488|nr:DUF2971 domain-containing protein [Cytophaga aurantiaca]
MNIPKVGPIKNTPQILYKYRNWYDVHHKSLLTDKELYFVSAKEFNDPFDINIKLDYAALSIDEFEQYCINLLKTDDLTTDELRKQLRNHPDFYTPEGLELQAKLQIEELRKTLGIYCLSAIWDSIPMWGYYGDSHKGYCIGLKTDNIYEKCSTLSEVSYQNEYPVLIPRVDLNNFDNFARQFSYKSISWEHEKEYRFIKLHFVNQIIKYNSKDVAEIILGFCMKPEYKVEILDICKTNFPDIPIYETELNPRQFKLERKLITNY